MDVASTVTLGAGLLPFPPEVVVDVRLVVECELATDVPHGMFRRSRGDCGRRIDSRDRLVMLVVSR